MVMILKKYLLVLQLGLFSFLNFWNLLTIWQKFENIFYDFHKILGFFFSQIFLAPKNPRFFDDFTKLIQRCRHFGMPDLRGEIRKIGRNARPRPRSRRERSFPLPALPKSNACSIIRRFIRLLHTYIKLKLQLLIALFS